jgi:hypothetical protein
MRLVKMKTEQPSQGIDKFSKVSYNEHVGNLAVDSIN